MELSWNQFDPYAVKNAVDAIYLGISVVIFGLLIRVSTGKTPYWYSYLEQLLGVGFIATALGLVVLLPVTKEAVIIYFAHLFFQVILFYVLPGYSYEGLPVAEEGGASRKYKCNGLLALIVTVTVFYLGAYYEYWNAAIIYIHFSAILNVANIFAILGSLALYVKGKFAPTITNTSHGNWALDIWYGIELNPEILGFDIKFWSESRPGLIGWVLIDLSMMSAQFQLYGYISTPMLLVCATQIIYVIDYFVYERFLVSTWDIAFEKLGFMLFWGCYVWVPFFYSLQTWFLFNPTGTEMSEFHIVATIVTFIVGFTIFRGSNRQKHLFKTWLKGGRKSTDQKGGGFFFNATPDVYKTASGSYLLVSGWWGLARHTNYLGDLIISLAWALPCGLLYGVYPYSHLLFMIGLLLHRFARDDEVCAQKYGADWNEYCKRVPYKLIPYVF